MPGPEISYAAFSLHDGLSLAVPYPWGLHLRGEQLSTKSWLVTRFVHIPFENQPQMQKHNRSANVKTCLECEILPSRVTRYTTLTD